MHNEFGTNAFEHRLQLGPVAEPAARRNFFVGRRVVDRKHSEQTLLARSAEQRLDALEL